MFAKYGWRWPDQAPEYGTKKIQGVTFKCCTQCHKPLDDFVAMDLNNALGIKPRALEDILSSLPEIML